MRCVMSPPSPAACNLYAASACGRDPSERQPGLNLIKVQGGSVSGPCRKHIALTIASGHLRKLRSVCTDGEQLNVSSVHRGEECDPVSLRRKGGEEHVGNALAQLTDRSGCSVLQRENPLALRTGVQKPGSVTSDFGVGLFSWP